MSTHIEVGKSACPDGQVHRWPQRSGLGNHTFGAAAFEREGGRVEVIFYADVFGKRTGAHKYPAEEWDAAMGRIVENRENMRGSYDVLDAMVTAFGHMSLKTMVEFDEDAPVAEQVRISRPDDERVMTDSVASAGAFLVAASMGEFYSSELLPVSHVVSSAEYYEQRPVAL